jgi:hypothetical protein
MARMQIEADRPGVSLDQSRERQLCVPAVTVQGESYRLKEKRKAGLLGRYQHRKKDQ